MSECHLCSEASRESVLVFHHVRKADRVSLEIALCEACGNNIEKHLKRAIPKRLMEVSAVDEMSLRNSDPPGARKRA